MKDKLIIKTISIIYSSIVSFFVAIALLLIIFFIALFNGIYIQHFDIANISVDHLSVKWNNKIDLSIKKLRIVPQDNASAFTLTLKQTNKYIAIAQSVTELFDTIDITSLEYADTNASLHYTTKDDGYFKLNTPTMQLNSQLNITPQGFLEYKIYNFTTTDTKINLKGIAYLDTRTAHLYYKTNIALSDANITLYGMSDTQTMHYALKSNKPIQNIKPLIDMAHLPKSIYYWAYSAIKMDHVDILKFHGTLDYANLQEAYKKIYILADIKKLHYTYNKKLDAIHTKHTELEFKDGIFYIRPKSASTYKQSLGNSWLKIDFTQPQEMLDIHLLLNGKLNKNILKILQAYNIELPILQHSGYAKTDLTLTINLRTITVDAQGKFYVSKGNFDYLGMNLDVAHANILLNNYDIRIKNMAVSLHKDIYANALVNVTFNAHVKRGTISMIFNQISYNSIKLASKNLRVIYRVHPLGDTLLIPKSQWHMQNHTLTLAKLKIPFNMKTLVASISPTLFSINDATMKLQGYVGGKLLLKKKIFDGELDIIKLHLNGLKLAQSTLQLGVHYDKTFQIKTTKKIYFSLNGSQYISHGLNISIHKNHINFNKTLLHISDFITTNLRAYYNTRTKHADIHLDTITIKNPKTKHILYKNKDLKLEAQIYKNKVTLISKELKSYFVSNKDGWNVSISTLQPFAKNSPFLRGYQFTNGKITLAKKTDAKYTDFHAEINYPYTLLRTKGSAISHYTIKGKIKHQGDLFCTINNVIRISYKNKLSIKIHDTTIDIDNTLKAIKNITHNMPKTKTKKDFNILLDATNTQLYVGNNRYILSDKITMQYYDKILTAQLLHKKGFAGLKYKDGTFHLYGDGFGDTFMQKLLSLSKFKGGTLEFSMQGKLDDYNAVFFINNTTIKDYKLINNILAFINTVPSLMTFSIPGYNKDGLAVKEAYMKFHALNGYFNISDIYLDSKELKILGKGKASIDQDMIDILLNLKTDLGSNLSKIPLVGYLIFDGESLSTTLKITGKLTDPKVDLHLAQDIMVAPLNIIKRTITLPFKIIQSATQ